MKFFLWVFTLVVFISPESAYTQCLTFSSVSSGYDYAHINRSGYTYAFPQGTAMEKYQYSAINISNQLAELAHDQPFGTQKLISLGSSVKFQATKISYTPFLVQVNGQSFPLRMIFVRPNDNVVRPCVLLSLGAGANLDNWYNYFASGIADYISRGYAVALYENYNNKPFMQVAGATCDPFDTNMPVHTHPELPFYGLYQFARAAAKCVVGQASNLKINTDLLFAGGYSAGGFSAYALALGDEDNFSDPMFAEVLGHKDDKVYPQWKNKAYYIKGIGILGSGLIFDGPAMGELISPDDAGLAAVLWHGGDDPLIHLECCDSAPCSGPCPQDLTVCGALTVGEHLRAAGIHTQVYVNCPGGHAVWHRLLTNSQTSGMTFPLPSLNIAVLTGLNRELQQLTSMQNQITATFQSVINGTPLPQEAVQSYQPVHFPNPLGNIWTLCPLSAAASCVTAMADAPVSERQYLRGTEHAAPIIYPNPSTSTVRIQWAEEGRITILDATGRTLAQHDFTSPSNDTWQYTLPLPGIYTVMCCNDQGCVSEHIVITQ